MSDCIRRMLDRLHNSAIKFNKLLWSKQKKIAFKKHLLRSSVIGTKSFYDFPSHFDDSILKGSINYCTMFLKSLVASFQVSLIFSQTNLLKRKLTTFVFVSSGDLETWTLEGLKDPKRRLQRI